MCSLWPLFSNEKPLYSWVILVWLFFFLVARMQKLFNKNCWLPYTFYCCSSSKMLMIFEKHNCFKVLLNLRLFNLLIMLTEKKDWELTRGVSCCGLAIYIKKYLKAKEELWKLKYFTMQNIIVKKSSKRNQNPSRCYNSITNLKFQHKPKYHLSKILM
jgi:hypothetical protein